MIRQKKKKEKMEMVFTVELAMNPSFYWTQNDVSRDRLHEHFYSEVKSLVLWIIMIKCVSRSN